MSGKHSQRPTSSRIKQDLSQNWQTPCFCLHTQEEVTTTHSSITYISIQLISQILLDMLLISRVFLDMLLTMM